MRQRRKSSLGFHLSDWRSCVLACCCRGTLWGCVLIATLTCVRLASAQDTNLKSFGVRVLASETERVQFERAVLDLLRGSGVTVTFGSSEAIDVESILKSTTYTASELGGAWVDLNDPSSVRLYLVDGPGQRMLIRLVKERNQPAAVARETLARMLASGVQALAAGGTIGIAKADVLANTVATAPATSPNGVEGLVHWAPYVGATFTAFSSERPFVAGIGLGFDMAAQAPSNQIQLFMGVWGGLDLPFEMQSPAVGIRVAQSRLGGVVGAQRMVNGLELSASLGLGLHLLSVSPFASDVTAEWTKAPLHQLIGVGLARVSVAGRISGQWRWLVQVASEMPFARVRYEVQNQEPRDAFEQPWFIQPCLLVGLMR